MHFGDATELVTTRNMLSKAAEVLESKRPSFPKSLANCSLDGCKKLVNPQIRISGLQMTNKFLGFCSVKCLTDYLNKMSARTWEKWISKHDSELVLRQERKIQKVEAKKEVKLQEKKSLLKNDSEDESAEAKKPSFKVKLPNPNKASNN